MLSRRLLLASLFAYALSCASTAFALGTVAGQFTDARSGAPVPGVLVELGTVVFGGFDPTGRQTVSDATGHYQLAIPAGSTYALRVSPATPLLFGYWPDIFCSAGTQCGFPGLGNVSVQEGGTFQANMQLTTPGSVLGKVTREFAGSAIAGISVRLDRTGQMGFVSVQAATDAQGKYRADGLPPGVYRVYVEDAPGYRSEIYDNVPCAAACTNGASGETLIPLLADQTRDGIDIALAPASGISGLIHEKGSGGLAVSVGLRLDRLVGGNWILQDSQSLPAGSGGYSFTSLPAGTYTLSTYGGGLTYNNVVYAGIDCAADDCTATERAAGTPISLLTGQSIVLDPIQLQPAASITACVQDVQTSAPLPGVHVIAYSSIPYPIVGYIDFNSAITGSDGCARIDYLAAAPSGLRLRTANNGGYVDRIYNGIPCLGNQCNLGGGALVPLLHDQDLTGLSFALIRGASIAGKVLARSNGPGVPNAALELVGADGFSVRFQDLQRLRTPASGSFRTFALPDGSYTLNARITNENNLTRIYTYTGGPLTISQGVSVENILFVLEGETMYASGFETP